MLIAFFIEVRNVGDVPYFGPLWLNDETFGGRWESDVPIPQDPEPAEEPQPPEEKSDFDVLENMQFLEMDKRISWRDIPKGLPLLDQEPFMPGGGGVPSTTEDTASAV